MPSLPSPTDPPEPHQGPPPKTFLALVFSVYSSIVSFSGYVFYCLGLWYVTHTIG
ncbi:hypothetical protein RchiOBHm_Chr2g0165031 [Rosa chinensis]|uniref:Uncharacterized protein n=1 Tax=Rosa chinensis TaxID=74649 RepID=A0A2P6S3Q1_ROSCH|nr:hypothetical protein RchiOBHm_Chr2g0165031 [Rosa chinensis]